MAPKLSGISFARKRIMLGKCLRESELQDSFRKCAQEEKGVVRDDSSGRMDDKETILSVDGAGRGPLSQTLSILGRSVRK
jgi:hypothetical protein